MRETIKRSRSTAFQINGGAGRVMCAIPALELYQKSNPQDDFIIITENPEMFIGHPTLYDKVYDFKSKNLFRDKLKERDYIIPEPYAIYEYYNQKTDIIGAFDIAINNMGIRPIHKPNIYLNHEEMFGANELISSMKNDASKSKLVIIQPFGRTNSEVGCGTYNDPMSRSLSVSNLTEIIKGISSKCSVLIMSEFNIDLSNIEECKDTAQVPNLSLRQWLSLINNCDLFIGCDSVGQHAANAFNKKAIVILGSTFKENVTYPNNKDFNIFDFNEGNKLYAPIRLCLDEVSERLNENLLNLTDIHISNITKTINKQVG